MVANDGFFSMFVQQILAQSPVLLVHLVGLVLSLVWLRRANLPAILCMLGCGLTLFTACLFTGLSIWLRQSQMQGGMGFEQMASWMSMLSLASSILRAVGASLIIAAVFVRRTPPSQPLPRPARSYAAPTGPEPYAATAADNPEGYRSTPKREGY
jgi:hypothetical protein